MSWINVVVAAASKDLKATGIAEYVAPRRDMKLVGGDGLLLADADAILESSASAGRCALVLVGSSAEIDEFAQRWLEKRDDLVVMHVDLVDVIVRIGLRNPRTDSLLTALRELAESVGPNKNEQDKKKRVARVILRQAKSDGDTAEYLISTQRPLLQAATDWVHHLLRDAVFKVPDENGDMHGFSVTRATLLQLLDVRYSRTSSDKRIAEAESALDRLLDACDEDVDPLAMAAKLFRLGPLEFHFMILMLAPELDLLYQQCLGFLLDEMSRRIGTISLYSKLLGIPPAVRGELINGGGLSRWFVLDGYQLADEPLRLDPFFAQWLLGQRVALADDPRVRRALRLSSWPGASLLRRSEEQTRATTLIERLRSPSNENWLFLADDESASWRALLELGSQALQVAPIRVEPLRLTGADIVEIEECAGRIGRLARLTGDPLIIDITQADGAEGEDYWLRLFLETLYGTGCSAAVICDDETRTVRLLGTVAYEMISEPALSAAARVGAMRAAATEVGIYLTDDSAESITNRYPLRIDRLEHAMCLARSRPKNYASVDPDLERLTTAFKELASEGISQLVDQIDPIFSLDDVVLPPDRKQQLTEIVDNVRFAHRVLDEWKFREQLPYGRGVTALFFGSSGTGKTMAAMGIARRLGIQILRLDLSRVVSKFIGDTEKNIDRVFTDAQRSGAAILIDEADALLGKRSEVKDAHDRYANIEVAYLLQRMEAYEGLAILTTNMRKNLDPAFLRRLRFIVDFPRPDLESREAIWRQCLPPESHELDDADFRQLARRLDLTGGQIRQITLRAAFVAAAAGEQITLEHVAYAARAELTKLGLPSVEIDLSRNRRAA